jgi:hypothetical protein
MASNKILFCINVDYFIFSSRIYTVTLQEAGVRQQCRFCDMDASDFKNVETLVWFKSVETLVCSKGDLLALTYSIAD